MWKHIKDKYTKADIDFVTKVVACAFLMIMFVLTLRICIDAPVQPYFRGLAKNDVWFGDDWCDIREDNLILPQNEKSLRVKAKDHHAEITKTILFTPDSNEYLCFRVRAQDVAVYVNDNIIYQNSFKEKYRMHSKQMFRFHQMSVDGVKAGDQITVVLDSNGVDFFSIQFISVGDRYALVKYILRKSISSLFICIVALIIMVVSAVTSHSPVLAEKVHDVKSLRWLTAFLALSVLYLANDSGYMEILVERAAVTNWFKGVSLTLLPIPFIMFTKTAFFPGHKRYEILTFFNFILCIVSVSSFLLFGYSLENFFLCVHVLIALDIMACIASFAQEKIAPAPEVIGGFGAIIIGAAASVAAYWNGMVVPASTLFGYGLLIFSICMPIWIVRTRYEMDKLRSEADHVFLERDKQAAQKASEEKSRFLSHMSHEIRTPLNAILGMNQLILNETKDDRIKQYSDNIQSAGRTLLALINDVLDFSKIETGKIEIIETDYSLSAMLNDVVLMIQGRADSKGLALQFDVDERMPDLLCGDDTRIKQVILNLMTNAVKYTKQGWIKLSVTAKDITQYLDEEQVILKVSVSDSGIGIKDEEKGKLFKEFERLDRQKNRSIEGTGLGLSITAQLVAIMKGKISVDSVYGEGSTFTVEIPQRVRDHTVVGDYKKRFDMMSNEHEETQENVECGQENIQFSKKRVFVVDDNEMNLEVIVSILEFLDLKVEKAGGGQEAIELLDKEPFDLILTDDMMPEVDGRQVMLHLHENKDSANHTTPIVVLTANAMAGAREEYMKIGFNAYMTKPIDIEVLQKILIKYLK